ncbi:hypothetical protein V6N13_115835 [Hibiscus sabdariffa]|uniref:Ribosome-inactivating protein n=1 Tax=Hibiscus sabdariffa TaxID=183260 RepID=A0ABR2CSX8_9ROSI
MRETDPRRYLLVELLDEGQSVTIALDVTDVYVLGYRPGTEPRSHFFRGVSEAVRGVAFPNTQGQPLPFTENYVDLQRNAGVSERSEIPLGIDELRGHIQNMNDLEPSGPNAGPLARALFVCIQMISEAARSRFIEQEIAAVAQRREGGYYEILYPDGLMIAIQNGWHKISAAVQSATWGIFPVNVRLKFDPQADPLIFDTVASVRFLVALMQVECENREANMQYLQMPASISSSSLPVVMGSTGLQEEDEPMFGFSASLSMSMAMRSTGTGLQENNDTSCNVVLAQTSHIMGQNGLCVDVYQGSYHNGNKIILWKCGQNQANQLWTLRSDDNTIRSGGKCLTVYGYNSGSYMMIYDCDKAVPDATKWEIRSDGAIRNPKSGLVLTGSKDSSGMLNLVVDYNIYSSKQAFYASKNTTSPVTTIVSYQGMCLLASGSQVRLETCARKGVEQQWAIYPDGTIRPQKNINECLKYANAGGASVNIATCDGWIGERWRFQNGGTILHVGTQKVVDVEDTKVTVNDFNKQRLSQIWFQGQP